MILQCVQLKHIFNVFSYFGRARTSIRPDVYIVIFLLRKAKSVHCTYMVLLQYSNTVLQEELCAFDGPLPMKGENGNTRCSLDPAKHTNCHSLQKCNTHWPPIR